MPLDLLAFGAHPDDIEIGLGGCVARHTAEGKVVGMCDLTAGELGSNGTPAQRLEEANEAAVVLGVVVRENLEWPDGGITGAPDQLRSAVDCIRRHRPRTVAIPYWADRHPDHVGASQVLATACHRSGLRRFETTHEAWRPDWVCYYFINDGAPPSFVVDVSAWYENKRAALACHRTQFAPADPSAVATRLVGGSFQQLVESRDAQFGALAGVAFAEGIVVREPVLRGSLLKDTP
jgi:bacillithiol biosynthesis deacetylase BshB1